MFDSEIFSQNIYISIFLILGVLALFGAIKRLFKLLWSLLILFILFLIFMIITNQDFPIEISSFMDYLYSVKNDFINSFKDEASKVIEKKSEEIIDSIINQ